MSSIITTSHLSQTPYELSPLVGDGRPYPTDIFIEKLLKAVDNEWDLRAALTDWLEGDWAAATEGLDDIV